MKTGSLHRFSIHAAGVEYKDAWYALWRAYCAYYEVTLDERVTARTWERIVSATDPVHALIALDAHGTPLGLCNYVLHPNTWSDQSVCYLEDLYVAPAGRRQGIATAFIEQLKALGAEQKWFRIYWVTNQDNVAAQAVYDPIAKRTGYVRYEIALGNRSR
ncbi:GNAT family N-acetyltransferase [Burkholderia sp. Ax-1719]|uniref:GNAT family N-acetyltransferase n=1 Tax=Burkholderia sp. Ax-1719 TaxID=2608334 RepID=UPI001420F99C|nr:GNAT family N-acetyltransferase [Burkholderia sp. Ax-1719]